MNDELKEILEGIEVVIKHDGTLEFNAKELKILLDYITNLQEEKEDYKSRCGNSINFIDQVLQFHLSRFDKKQIDEDINTLIGILSKRGNE